jgi:hypothetical protein
MNVKSILLMLMASLFLLTTIALGQDLMIYPAKGQSNDQMEKDKYECYTWAKGQTGFDPMQIPKASSPPPSQEKKSVGGAAVVGGALGAAGGAIVGGIAGGGKKVGRGAAIGALSGGAIGGIRSSSQNKQTEQQRKQWEQEQVNQYARQRNAYDRAYSACLEGRGYTVK